MGGTFRQHPRPEDEDITGPNLRTVVGDSSVREDFLILLTGGQMGQPFPLRADELVVGRAADCGVVLPEDGVSRRHARLFREGGVMHIEDLGSTNGTFVDGARLADRRPLADGAKIGFGNATTCKYASIDPLEADYQRRMFDAAAKDALTGAYNRRHFHERLEAEVAFANRHGAPLALLMIDIDHFKEINDAHGHLIGDLVLRVLGRRFATVVRTEDLLARYGGEEFALLSRVGLEGALALGERLRVSVAGHPVSAHGLELPITTSVGVAVLSTERPESARELVDRADQALYMAKRRGRNRVEPELADKRPP